MAQPPSPRSPWCLVRGLGVGVGGLQLNLGPPCVWWAGVSVQGRWELLFRVLGFGCRVLGLGSRGVGFGVEGFRIKGLKLKFWGVASIIPSPRSPWWGGRGKFGYGFLGFGVRGWFRISVSGCMSSGFMSSTHEPYILTPEAQGSKCTMV